MTMANFSNSMNSNGGILGTSAAAAGAKPSLIQSIALGGASCVFTVNFTHPIELVKTRMQVSGDGLVRVVGTTYANEGVGAFWKGIVWAWGREGSYASIKLGAYAPVRNALIGGDGKNAPFYLKFLAGALTGGVGSIIGNPFDVLKTLAQANKGKAVPLGTLVTDMYNQQGLAGFYRGVQANVMRACVLNATKMGCYDIAKGAVADATGWGRKDIKTVFCSASLAGFFMTCTVSPFDRIRTNLMNQPTDKKIYNGFIDCASKTIQEGGVASLWRGFVPIWARFAPTATIQLITIEALYSSLGFASI
mmetsp:Transcript_1764/g.4345  ORF Transcript_1764/g.4345 Transcript_1764/m.4345 type:complete len:306 (+) Transcript_1764:219-1136(+)|eukprot:CAMPEP_0119556674 /NCGR_PEP_ID=MMETSP1352-20130426/8550_1 /TAXON_ID=265584 /ORGANISM="Stauroneis constricta, Strain CCMP1120" /LENGTH=305 /DNA_ID=CAMNT_0007603655 /DNA_START=184 /DNA_END=1101 /DNA_ORIENTATION=+